MFFENYTPENIRPKIVDHEGKYEVKVNEVIPGSKDNKRYVRIDCVINYAGYPHVSLFLTEGDDFNSRFTAFCDTFGVTRGDQNFENWKGHKGWLDIKLREKDGYKNMVPYYITDENGWVLRSQQSQMQQNYQAQPMQQQYTPRPQMQQNAAPQQQQTNTDELGDVPF